MPGVTIDIQIPAGRNINHMRREKDGISLERGARVCSKHGGKSGLDDVLM